ncbi:MAG: hypothetical protein DI556_04470 [Rhodovulum sulfidophilum]|uniref:Peptidase metallopeptidase domain-containing protein n=1 Tax=Rhodovulum sulfidophilum TaxID=35806 RepID=A0A2W5NKP2_RHOSU|nr:MAG: hypothetical protein DI556_04470 [Rhodovulum sulfidophilum]
MAAYFIEALRNQFEETDSWRHFANPRDGAAARLTYSFMTRVPDGTSDEFGDPEDSFMTYIASERAEVERGLARYESVANIRFARVGGEADINFGQFDIDEGMAGYAFYPMYDKTSGVLRPGEVWLDYPDGVLDRYVIIHEIGHALGLKHSFREEEDDADVPVLPGWEDNGRNTVMSYDRDGEDRGLGLFDVIALQSIYGPARSRRGDNTYEFGEDKLIWDGGGEDRITARGSERGVTIDLAGGSWNHEGAKGRSLLWEGQVFLGHFTEIEHATGGRHDDRLSGNGLRNRLDGGDGDDRLSGRAERDRLSGGDGNDALRGGAGDDRLLGGAGADLLEGGAGADLLRGGAGADRFVFERLASSAAAAGDLIFDFARGEGDRIDLSGIGGLTFLGRSTFSGVAGEARYDHRAAEGTRLVIDGDGDGVPDFRLAFDGRITLREDDLIL